MSRQPKPSPPLQLAHPNHADFCFALAFPLKPAIATSNTQIPVLHSHPPANPIMTNQINKNPSPSPPSTHSVAIKVALAPLLPFMPVIATATHLAAMTNCAVLKTHEKSKVLVTEEENVEDEYLTMVYDTHQKSEVVAIMGNVGAGLKQRSTRLPWFAGEPALGSSILGKSVGRQIGTTAFAVTSPVTHLILSDVCISSFDPDGTHLVTYPSAMRRLRPHQRLLSRPLISTSDPPYPSPTRDAPTRTSPSAAFRSGKSSEVPFPVTAQPTGPASGWPWVPRSKGTYYTRASPLPCLPPKPPLEPLDWLPFRLLNLGQANCQRWSPFRDGAVLGSASGAPWVPWSLGNTGKLGYAENFGPATKKSYFGTLIFCWTL